MAATHLFTDFGQTHHEVRVVWNGRQGAPVDLQPVGSKVQKVSETTAVSGRVQDPEVYVEHVCGSQAQVVKEETHTLVQLGLDAKTEGARCQYQFGSMNVIFQRPSG